jgi:ABC-type amino acid transport substrate-binding protein
LCAQNVQSGRADFTGWLSSADTVEDAIAKGTPMVLVGDPVFYESLGVAFDNTVADNDSLVAAVDTIIGQMRDDGTLLMLSVKWFNGKDRVSGQ